MLRAEDLELKRKIANAARSIRKKYLALKLQRDENDMAINKVLAPLTTPLQQIVENTSTPSTNKKMTKKISKGENTINTGTIENTSTPLTLRKKLKKIYSTPSVKLEKSVENYPSSSKFLSINNDDNDEMYYDVVDNDETINDGDDDDDDSVTFNHPINEENFRKSLDKYPTTVQSFMEKYHKEPKKIDKTFGFIYNPDSDSWSIGSSKVEFLPSGDISILDQTYKGTQGLYELLFFKKPKGYSQADVQSYIDILQKTNVYRIGNSPTGKVKSCRSFKYKHFVKPAIKFGHGLQ